METIARVKSSPDGAGTHALAPLVASWRRHLSAIGRAPKTIVIYTSAADAFGRYLTHQGMPDQPDRDPA